MLHCQRQPEAHTESCATAHVYLRVLSLLFFGLPSGSVLDILSLPESLTLKHIQGFIQ